MVNSGWCSWKKRFDAIEMIRLDQPHGKFQEKTLPLVAVLKRNNWEM